MHQYRYEFSKNYMSWNRKKNSTQKMTQNLKRISFYDFIGRTHYLRELKHKQLKLSWLSTIIFLPDVEETLRWTKNSRWNSHQKLIKLFISKAYQCQPAWKKTQCWVDSDAKKWNHYNTALHELSKSQFCTEKTQGKSKSSASQKNQQGDFRWIQQK